MPEHPIDLGSAAEIARMVTVAGEDPGMGWLKEVRVTVVWGHPGGEDSEHGYVWRMPDA